MQYTLQNEKLKTTIDSLGAELISIKSIESGLEYLWQGNKTHWGRHAPVLFPIVGKLHNNTYKTGGKSYPMSQHGFARDQDFVCTEQQAGKLAFVLQADENTRETYPFDFRLCIIYELRRNQLYITYQVENLGKETMPFSIGAHPGFNCPLFPDEEREHYYLEFEKEEKLETLLLKGGLFTGKSRLLENSSKIIALNAETFAEDAIVLKDLRSDYISLKNNKNVSQIRVGIKGFPYLGIWSKSAVSPFVCIEPWFGLADFDGFNGEIKDKTGIQSLAPSVAFHCSYWVEVVG